VLNAEVDHLISPGGRSSIRPTASPRTRRPAGWSGRPLRVHAALLGFGVRCCWWLPMLPCIRRQHDPGEGYHLSGAALGLGAPGPAAGGSLIQPPSGSPQLPGRASAWLLVAGALSLLAIVLGRWRSAHPGSLPRLVQQLLRSGEHRQRHRQVPAVCGVLSRTAPFMGREPSSSMGSAFRILATLLHPRGDRPLSHPFITICCCRSGQEERVVPLPWSSSSCADFDPPSDCAQHGSQPRAWTQARRMGRHLPSRQHGPCFLYLLASTWWSWG